MKMKRLSQNQIIALFIAAFVLVALGCIAAVAINGFKGGVGSVEIEDCDKEDRRNREYAECGYIPPAQTTKPAVVKTPAKPAVTPAKPAPRTTRR